MNPWQLTFYAVVVFQLHYLRVVQGPDRNENVIRIFSSMVVA